MSIEKIGQPFIPPPVSQGEDDKDIQNVQTTGGIVTESELPPAQVGAESPAQPPDLNPPTTQPDAQTIEELLNKFDQLSDDDLKKLAALLAQYSSNLPPAVQEQGGINFDYLLSASPQADAGVGGSDAPKLGSSGGSQTDGAAGAGSAGEDDTTVGDGLSFGEFIQLMLLMQKIFQQQRKAAREARHAEMQLQQQEIQKQVDALKDAATTALVMGIAMAVVTIGMATVSSMRSIKAAKTYSKGIDAEFSAKGIKTYREAGQPKIETEEPKLTQPRPSTEQPQQPSQTETPQTKPSEQPKPGQKQNLKQEEEPETQLKAEETQKEIKEAEQKKVEQKKVTQKEDEKSEEVQEEQAEQQGLKETKAKEQEQTEEIQKPEAKEQEQVESKGSEQKETEDVQEEQPKLQELNELKTKAQKQFEKMKKNLGDELPDSIKNKNSIDELDEHDLAELEALARQLGSVKGELISNTANLWRTYNQAAGQFMGGMRDYFTQNSMANATLHEKEAKVHEQHIQDETEWMQNMRDLIRDAQEAVRAVQQSLIETEKAIFTQI